MDVTLGSGGVNSITYQVIGGRKAVFLLGKKWKDLSVQSHIKYNCFLYKGAETSWTHALLHIIIIITTKNNYLLHRVHYKLYEASH